MTWRAWLSSALLLLALSVPFAAPAYADKLDDDTRHIGKQLQCPVCSGAPVSDSPSDLAGQMRSVIRAKLAAGETEDQIIAYFVERYGDSVLIEPPHRGIGLFVWLAPIVMLLVGGLVLWRVSRIWLARRQSPLQTVPAGVESGPYRNGSAHTGEDLPASPVDRARAEFEQFRRGA
ncbi:MAG: cytochrome c-type biogenesis protein CcmH [Chloroflexota bacterium]